MTINKSVIKKLIRIRKLLEYRTLSGENVCKQKDYDMAMKLLGDLVDG